MKLFHDEEDGPAEPTPGLPEALPEDETILWQGRPGALQFTLDAFRLRWVAAYVLILTVWRLAHLASEGHSGVQLASALGVSALAAIVGGVLIFGLSWAMARSTLYTITDKRVVLRYGAAIRKYVNLPFSAIKSASLRRLDNDHGSIAIALTKEASGAPFLYLWPHARPFRFANAQPMIRAVPAASGVAHILFEAVKSRTTGNLTVDKTNDAPQSSGVRSELPVTA